MTLTDWFIFFIAIQVIHFLATWKLYVKAGRQAWEAIVPIYNAIVLMQIINRPKWWVILLFIPIVNLLMFPIVWIETCRSFGHNKNHDTILAVLTLGFYLFYINYTSSQEHIKDRSLDPRTALGEWVSSISFAIIAATLVHTYFMQPYTIPTSSLEKTLYVGDYLFVSKFHYGARVPMTPVAAPMVHDTLPFLGKSYISNSKDQESWLNKFSLPYLRLPGIQKIKRNDIVVFSWPADSTNSMYNDYSKNFTYKPIDKRTNYVKRCVGIPGDSLEVRDGYVYINGKRTVLPDRAKPQYIFTVDTGGKQFSRGALNRYNIREAFWDPNTGLLRTNANGEFVLNLTDEEAALIAKNPIVKKITKNIEPKGTYNQGLFPHNPQYKWSQDNYGPIYIPKKGDKVALNEKSIPFYEQIIRRYEHNNFNIADNKYYLNGKEITSYTFKQDYYWMMGDNRHNSLDARAWGYVPFDHVVGKPVFIWLSWDPNAKGFAKLSSIRWDRMFTTVGGSGEPYSYFRFFVIALVGYFVINYFRKKKKAAN